MLLNNLGAIVSDILYTLTFGKGSSQLCAHFSVCAVHLYCSRGPTASPLRSNSYLLEQKYNILHRQFKCDTELKLTHGEATLPDDVMRDIYHMF